MKRNVMGWLTAAALALAVPAGWCAEVKIAIVDMARVVKAHPDTPSADSLLEKQLAEYQTEQKDMEVEFDKLKKAFDEARKETLDKALSEGARAEKVEVAEERLAAVRDYERKLREMFNSRQKQLSDQSLRMRKRIIDKIRKVVEDYAAEKGYALVLDSAGLSVNGVELVLFSSPKIDITDDLVKIVGKAKASDMKGPEEKPAKEKAPEVKPGKTKAPETKPPDAGK